MKTTMARQDGVRPWRGVLATCLVSHLLAAAVEGHDLWVVPGKFALEPGERFRVFVNSGDEFPTSDSLVGEHRLDRFDLVAASGRRALEGFAVDGKSLTVEVTAPEGGIAILVLAVKPRLIRLKAAEFNEYLKEDGLPHALRSREERGELEEPALERYTKCAKAIVRVGDGEDRMWSEPVGTRLEIVPAENPFALRAGGFLPLVLLFDGKPLSDVVVSAGRAGGPRNEVSGVTDAEGRVGLVLPISGRWYVRSIHMIRLEGDPEAEWESFWATLTFEVQP